MVMPLCIMLILLMIICLNQQTIQNYNLQTLGDAYATLTRAVPIA